MNASPERKTGAPSRTICGPPPTAATIPGQSGLNERPIVMGEPTDASWRRIVAAAPRASSTAPPAGIATGLEPERRSTTGADRPTDGIASGNGNRIAAALPDAPPWTDQERLAHEKEVLGLYVTGHPLGAYAPELARFADVTATTAAEKAGREVRVAGLLTGLRETRTRRGATMAFGTLEDLEGAFGLVIFAEPYTRLRPLLKEAQSPAPGEVASAGAR